jgi:hypothetical protein
MFMTKYFQDMTDNLSIALRSNVVHGVKMTLSILVEQVFFGTQALPKNRGAYVDDQNWQARRNKGTNVIVSRI